MNSWGFGSKVGALLNVDFAGDVADALADDLVAEGLLSKPFSGRRLLAEQRRFVPLS